MREPNSNLKGVSFLVLALLIISIQNIAIKWMGGDYSALEIVAVRSLVALPCTLLFFRFEGRRGLPTTQNDFEIRIKKGIKAHPKVRTLDCKNWKEF